MRKPGRTGSGEESAVMGTACQSSHGQPSELDKPVSPWPRQGVAWTGWRADHDESPCAPVLTDMLSIRSLLSRNDLRATPLEIKVKLRGKVIDVASIDFKVAL